MIDMMEDPDFQDAPSLFEKRSPVINEMVREKQQPQTHHQQQDMGYPMFKQEIVESRPHATQYEEFDSELPSENIIPQQSLPICPGTDPKRTFHYLSVLKVEYETCLRENSMLKEREENFNKIMRDAHTQINLLKDQVRKRDEYLSLIQAQGNIEQLRGELLNMKSMDQDNLMKELHTLRMQHDEMSNQMDNLRKSKNSKLKSFANEVKRLNEFLSQQETLLNSRNTMIRSLEEKISSLVNKYKISQSQMDEIDQGSQKQQDRINYLEKVIDSLKNERIEFEKKTLGAISDLGIVKREKEKM